MSGCRGLTGPAFEIDDRKNLKRFAVLAARKVNALIGLFILFQMSAKLEHLYGSVIAAP
ncbi:hypothetical protein D3C81_2032050 [compost metagenome]